MSPLPRRSLLLPLLAFALAAAAPPAPRAQPPADVTVQGVLEDANGLPLTGTRAWRVRFFDGPTGGAALGATASGTTTLDDRGRFSLEAPIPSAAVAAADLHYEVAIDTASAPDGTIDAADVFPDRTRVTSVPFARRSADADALAGRAADAFSPRLHGAVVDAAGGGDYTTIQAAILAGESSIYVRNGTYTLTADVQIPAAPFSLVGESPHGVIINAAGLHSIFFAGDTVAYTDGGVSIGNGATVVTSASGLPTFTTAAAPGDIIRLDRSFHEIASIDSDTQLTLRLPYRGTELTNASYSIATYGDGFTFRNLTFLNPPSAGSGNDNSTEGGICLRFARNIRIEACHARRTSDGFSDLVYLENSHNATITGCSVEVAGLADTRNCAEVAILHNLIRNSRSARAIGFAGRTNDEPNFGLLVVGNQIVGGSGAGAIRIAQARTTVPLSAIVANNHIVQFNSNGTPSVDGILTLNSLTSESRCVITGNTIDRGVGSAIVISSTVASNITITGNILTNNTGFALRTTASGTTDTLLTSNVIKGNGGGSVTGGTFYGTMNVPQFEAPVP